MREVSGNDIHKTAGVWGPAVSLILIKSHLMCRSEKLRYEYDS